MKIKSSLLMFLFLIIVIILLILLGINNKQPQQQSMLNMSVNSNLGGDFTLPSTLGHPLDLASLRGQAVLITFGYADCEEVCPIGLMRLHEVIQTLGNTETKLTVIFVAFDSEKKLTHLKEYIKKFDHSIIGVTGTEDEIINLTKRYGVVYPKEKGVSGEASFDHNGYIYLLDQQGSVRALYQNRTAIKDIVKDIKAL